MSANFRGVQGGSHKVLGRVNALEGFNTAEQKLSAKDCLNLTSPGMSLYPILDAPAHFKKWIWTCPSRNQRQLKDENR